MGENCQVSSYHVERLGCDAVVGKQLEGVRPELGGDLQRFRLGGEANQVKQLSEIRDFSVP